MCKSIDYGLDDRGIGVRFPARARDFSLLHSIQTGCAPPSLLSNGYWRQFPKVKSDHDVKLITHLHTAPRLRVAKLYLHSHIRLHGVMFD
jgi:hypothetical protein